MYKDQNVDKEEITVKNYGEYSIVLEVGKELLKMLKECFSPCDAERIFAMAGINLINGFTHLKNFDSIYEHSYFSEALDNLHLSKDTVAKFISDLGSRTTRVEKFYDTLRNKSSHKFSIDGHCINNYSKENDLSKFGNKYHKTNAQQINIMTMMDLETKYPLMTKTFEGSELDKTSIKEFLKIRKIENSLLVMDAGFFSKDNIELFSKDNNYIIPLSENLNEYKEISSLKFDKEFNYDGSKTPKLIESVSIKKGDKMIIKCRDIEAASKQKAEYLKNISLGTLGHSKEEFEKIKDKLGVIVLQTNLNTNEEEIYHLYKKR
jgi:transposase